MSSSLSPPQLRSQAGPQPGPPAPVPSTLLDQLATVPDPRIERAKRHKLVDLLAIAILATLSGADSYTEMAQYGHAREGWLRTFLELPNGIPSHDTFERVFMRLNRHAFADCLTQWAQTVALLAVGDVVAIDGKTARHSRDATPDSATHPLHTVSAWATRQQLVLGQVATEEKSNEITAIPALLALLNLRGSTVTIDALGCQTAIASAIRAQRAHYVLAVKSNQTWLHERVSAVFAHSPDDTAYWSRTPHKTGTTVEKDHGRVERRCYTIVPAAAVLHDRGGWTDLKSIGCVVSERTMLSGPHTGETTREARYFITSLASEEVAPFAHAVRAHWGIENSCHWTLDMVFGEDESRVRRGHGPANLATLRRWALSILKQDTTHPHGLKARRLQAAWDPDYLLKLLHFITPVNATT